MQQTLKIEATRHPLATTYDPDSRRSCHISAAQVCTQARAREAGDDGTSPVDAAHLRRLRQREFARASCRSSTITMWRHNGMSPLVLMSGRIVTPLMRILAWLVSAATTMWRSTLPHRKRAGIQKRSLLLGMLGMHIPWAHKRQQYFSKQ
jgi:hypothetical protein